MRSRRADGGAGSGGPSEVRQLLGWLEEDGCTFCRAEAEGGDRYWFWYLNEHYAEAGSLLGLRASHGFCGRHTEELLRRATPSTITTVYRYVLPQFARRLEGDDPVTGPSAACPACAAERDSVGFRMLVLVRHLRGPEVQRALDRSRSPCLAHLPALAGRLPRPTLAHVLGQAQDRLWRTAPDELGALLKQGERGPVPASEVSWTAAEVEPRPALPTLTRLAEVLAAPFCPGCLAAHDGAGHYLTWLPHVVGRAPFEQWADAIWLCRDHHWLLARAGGPATERVLDHARRHWGASLTELLQLLDPDRGLRGAREASARRPRLRLPGTADREAHDGVARLLALGPCPACAASATARRRMAELLVAALEDPRTAERYRASVGLCYHDLRGALAVRPPPAIGTVLRGTLRSRLALLLWELEERRRREAWNVRHEPKGPEQDAWKRAVRQFSGGVG